MPGIPIKDLRREYSHQASSSGDPSDIDKHDQIEIALTHVHYWQLEYEYLAPAFIDYAFAFYEWLERVFEDSVIDVEEQLIEFSGKLLEFDVLSTIASSEWKEKCNEFHLVIQPKVYTYGHDDYGRWKQELNETIAAHLYRQCPCDLGDRFLSEAGLPADELSALKSQFKQMHRITRAVGRGNIDQAMKWIDESRERLGQKGSELKSKLDELRQPQSDKAKRLDVIKEIERQFCTLMGQCGRSPLSVVTSAGAQLLPGLYQAAEIVTEELGLPRAILQVDEVPLNVSLGDEFQCHSRFTCPCSQKAMLTSLNPPVALACGHVLSLQTILSEASNGSAMECPFCEMVSSPPHYQTVYF
uniref:CTLH domain-containing protein n=1 Tax=Kalanchoe fedtschenkoi TaxID=63787 RepID=A0A7N0RAZ5_KALFE